MSDPDPLVDPWGELRSRLDKQSQSRWRGRWVPSRTHTATDRLAVEQRRTVEEPSDSAALDRDEGSEPAGFPQARMLRWPHVLVVGLLAALALGATALIVWSSRPQQETVGLAATAGSQTTGSPVADPALSPEPGIDPATGDPAMGDPAPRSATPTTVAVHVAGRVASPGVVELPAGSRVVDALDAAGGVLPDTALDAVNLARVLVDGEQVRVGLPPDPAVQSSEPPAAAAGSVPDGPIDLNTASAAELEELPGVGPVLAGRIVAWREENGPFTAVDQLLEVAGIGPAVFDDLDDRVRV